MIILAIDCGSTNLKAALFDGELRRLGEGTQPVVYLTSAPDAIEFAVEEFWQATVQLLKRVCQDAGLEPRQVSRIAIGSQAQTFTILDPAGRPLIPFISWIDKRPVAESEELIRRLGKGFHRHCSIPAPIPQLTLTKLVWLRRRQPDCFPAGAEVVPLPTYVARRMAGVSAVDRNWAAMGGLYSLAEGEWWNEALEACGLSAAQLPPLVDVGGAVPARRPCAELGLADNVEIVFAGNDQTANAVSVGPQAKELIVTLGTALVVYRHAGRKAGPYHEAGCWGPYPGGGFYELATRDEGGAALDWARGHLMPGGDISRFMSAAESAPAGQPVFFFPGRKGTAAAWVGGCEKIVPASTGPALQELRPPVSSRDGGSSSCETASTKKRAKDSQLPGDGDTASRARAVVEGISFNLRQLIEDDLRTKPGTYSLRVQGGGSASDFWLQLLADILACDVRRGAGDALLGAAMMATGTATPPDASSAMFRPRAGPQRRYRAAYQQWLAAVGRPG